MSKDQIWTYILKLLAVVGGILSVIKIIEWFTSPRAKLTASIQVVPFERPEAPKNNEDQFQIDQYMWVVVVSNSGKKPCEGTCLVLPDVTTAKINRVGSSPEYKSLMHGVIELGTIKPREKIEIRGWTRAWNSYAWRHFDQVQLSYNSGLGRILPRADAPKFCRD